jgi:uncharacterized Zn-binding protein involved in type VI secretion
MAGKPVATIGSMHVCPMVTGYIPHVGGPVTGPGMPGVTVNGQPIAVIGDMCTCVGPPDTIVQGCPGVTVNGTPVATLGSMTAHGGQITVGVPGVTISPNVPTPDAVMPLKQIPFPKISLLDIVGAAVKGKSKDLKQARKNQEEIKKAAEEQEPRPAIFNVRWLKDDKVTRDGRVKKAVRVSADVTDIADGETLTFSIERKNPLTEEVEKIEIEATVEEGKAVGEWEIKDQTESNHE